MCKGWEYQIPSEVLRNRILLFCSSEQNTSYAYYHRQCTSKYLNAAWQYQLTHDFFLLLSRKSVCLLRIIFYPYLHQVLLFQALRLYINKLKSYQLLSASWTSMEERFWSCGYWKPFRLFKRIRQGLAFIRKWTCHLFFISFRCAHNLKAIIA